MTRLSFTCYYRVSDGFHVEFDRPNRVIVTGNDVIDTIGITIGIDNTYDRNTELIRFGNGDALMINVNHKQYVGQSTHISNTTDRAVQLFFGTRTHQRFFLSQLVESAVSLLRFKFTQSLNRRTNGLIVGQHAAQPSVRYKWHATTRGFLFDHLASCTFGANE